MRMQDLKFKEIKPEDYHIYVDLDGVLADLKDYVSNKLGITLHTRDDGEWSNSNQVWKKLRARNEPRFDRLGMLPDADKLWSYIRKYRPNILTATGHPVEQNEAQKREWVKNKLSGYGNVYTVVASRNKSKFAWPDAILIDDRLKSIRPWRERGGIGIHHRNATDTIKQLQKLGL